MKKLISLLTLGLSLLTANAQSPHFISESLLNNCQWVVIPTNTTVQYNYTNVTYEQPILPQGWTNVLSLTTNINGNIVNQWGKHVEYFPDGRANLNTNYSVVIMINNTNLLLSTKPDPQGYPIAPLQWFNTNGLYIYGTVTNVYTNSYGIISTNLAYYYPTPPITPNANSTNQLTFNFVRETFPGIYSTNANDIWAVAVTNNSMGAATSAGFVVTTNVPAWFLTGARKIRLWSIVSASSSTAGSGQLINDIRLNGWTP